MKQIYEMNGRGHSARAIARELDLARNTVLRYLKSPEAIKPHPRPLRGSKLDPYTDHIDQRLSEGLRNCRVLLREISTLSYEGAYTTVADFVRPRRRARQPRATLRFETVPGEQAQMDWGSFSYVGDDGRQHRVWAFVMVLSWSRAIYVEFARRADVASFIQCLVNAFEYCGRRTLPLPLRRCQSGDPGAGRGKAAHLEPADAGLRPAGGFRDAAAPALPGPDQGQGRERGQVRQGQHVAQHAFSHDRRPMSIAKDWNGAARWPTGESTALPTGCRGRCCPRSVLGWGNFPIGQLWRPISRRSARWPGTTSSAGRDPATESTEMGGAVSCRRASAKGRWRSGSAMGASRCILGASVPGQRFIIPSQWEELHKGDDNSDSGSEPRTIAKSGRIRWW